jgi:hypothetical protein
LPFLSEKRLPEGMNAQLAQAKGFVTGKLTVKNIKSIRFERGQE